MKLLGITFSTLLAWEIPRLYIKMWMPWFSRLLIMERWGTSKAEVTELQTAMTVILVERGSGEEEDAAMSACNWAVNRVWCEWLGCDCYDWRRVRKGDDGGALCDVEQTRWRSIAKGGMKHSVCDCWSKGLMEFPMIFEGSYGSLHLDTSENDLNRIQTWVVFGLTYQLSQVIIMKSLFDQSIECSHSFPSKLSFDEF